MTGRRRIEKKSGKRIWFEGFVVLLFCVVGFFINRGIEIRGLYMDDLYMWSCYGEQSYLEFAFPIGTSTRFRPVYWTAAYLQMAVIRNHPELFVPMNILLNVLVAFVLYRMAKKLSGLELFSVLCGILYLVSHFAYYQIGQALGLLETQALILAILVFWMLYCFMHMEADYVRSSSRSMKNTQKLKNAKKAQLLYYGAGVIYVLLVFTHERYLSLLPLFYLALVFRKRTEDGSKHRMRWIYPLLLLGIITAIRSFAIGTAIPAGTGGTEVTDTFTLSAALGYAVEQVKYIFGINAGPAYLSGITWQDTAGWVHKAVYGSWIFLAIIVFLAGFSILCHIIGEEEEKGAYIRKRIGENLMFLLMIAMCIGCSSVTIRVEMRWIYVSYAMALLYLAYFAGVLREEMAEKKKAVSIWLMVCFLGYAALMTPVEVYYRAAYPNIYFWENQDRMNSLAEQTIEKYGDQLLGKQVYILGNTYEMTDFYAETFFKVYDPQRSGQGTRIHFVEDLSALPKEADATNSIVVQEDPPRGYLDITQQVFAE